SLLRGKPLGTIPKVVSRRGNNLFLHMKTALARHPAPRYPMFDDDRNAFQERIELSSPSFALSWPRSNPRRPPGSEHNPRYPESTAAGKVGTGQPHNSHLQSCLW